MIEVDWETLWSDSVFLSSSFRNIHLVDQRPLSHSVMTIYEEYLYKEQIKQKHPRIKLQTKLKKDDFSLAPEHRPKAHENSRVPCPLHITHHHHKQPSFIGDFADLDQYKKDDEGPLERMRAVRQANEFEPMDYFKVPYPDKHKKTRDISTEIDPPEEPEPELPLEAEEEKPPEIIWEEPPTDLRVSMEINTNHRKKLKRFQKRKLSPLREAIPCPYHTSKKLLKTLEEQGQLDSPEQHGTSKSSLKDMNHSLMSTSARERSFVIRNSFFERESLNRSSSRKESSKRGGEEGTKGTLAPIVKRSWSGPKKNIMRIYGNQLTSKQKKITNPLDQILREQHNVKKVTIPGV